MHIFLTGRVNDTTTKHLEELNFYPTEVDLLIFKPYCKCDVKSKKANHIIHSFILSVEISADAIKCSRDGII